MVRFDRGNQARGSRLRTILYAALFASLSACGNSPLLNHDVEGSVRASPANGAQAAAKALRFSDRLQAQIEWPSEPRLGRSEFIIRFFSPDGAPRDPASFLESKADMRGMTMLPSIISFERVMNDGVPVPGSYLGKLTFTMGGKWFMEIQVNDGYGARSAATEEFAVR